ncbi:chromosomal replication initiator protein DnaA [Candidatus Daviesbacteria bacterium]|nr:chromosomal replication initiator protein DnaA [Candidatus Daviesbacteria bacterium]
MDEKERKKIWTKITDVIKEEISSANFRTWFSQTVLGEISNEKMVIFVTSAFIKNQLLSRYQSLLEEAIEKTLGKKMVVECKINTTINSISEESFELETPPRLQSFVGLNPRYTLANFVVGLTNNLAYAAAQAVVQNPGISYNPLFIYGPSGVGKTHLMQAIGNAIFGKNSYSKIVYAPSERFMVDFVDSIQNKKTGDFRSKYRSSNLLLIDDIQFIAGKDSTQEEFFHTFNELHSKNCQIVLTSDRPPNEMVKLESRLLSRFQGGLMVDIQLPDFDTRMAILKTKLKEREETLPEEYLKLIAENIESNTRELEGKLIQILQMSKLSNQPLNEDSVRKFLGSRHKQLSANIDHKKVLTTLNNYFNIKTADLTGPRRQKELVLPRHLAMYILYEECKIPMEKIGQILGGRDHTTILHGIEKIRGNLGRDREVQRLLIEIKQQLLN